MIRLEKKDKEDGENMKLDLMSAAIESNIGCSIISKEN
jgi:hypothetical protein